jgi:hypothetical protein
MRIRILTIVVAVCFSVGVAQPSHAQSSRTAQISYSQPELEQLRTELLNLADAVQSFSAVAPKELFDAQRMQAARAQIQQMSPEQLNVLRQGFDPSKIHSRLALPRATLAKYNTAPIATGMKRLQDFSVSPADSVPFPNANGFCTSANGTDVNRIPTAVVLAADVVWFVADGLREGLQDACKETLVVVGEGGNTSLACVPVDVIWIIAKAVDEGIHFCDDDLTGAVVDANYARLADIHTDVNAADDHLTNVDNHVATEFVALDNHVTNVDTHVALEFGALDAHLVTLFGQLSTQLTNSTDLATADLKQVMKLELTPEGLRKIVPSILTCTGTDCPNVLNKCPAAGCSWNNVGPLP